MYNAKYMYPWKKELGIHIDAIRKERTNRNLNIQQPSWKIDAPVFLGKIAKNIRKWKHTRIKLILVTKDIPTQGGLPSSSKVPPQYIAEGKILSKSYAV